MTLKFPGNSFLSIILFQKKPRYTLKATTHSLKLSRIYTHTRTFTHTDTHTHTLFLWFSRGEIEFVWIDDIYMKVYITLCMSSLHQISNYRVWWKILNWFFKNMNWFPSLSLSHIVCVHACACMCVCARVATIFHLFGQIIIIFWKKMWPNDRKQRNENLILNIKQLCRCGKSTH